ncbi:UNVERIFIED_CONTAM: hypothetical protein HDU68_006992 [Siphonaria sp. JEL0065]|nr:hypothetical protein HDU68_006992 [Siphonaria sp. JEL0065]
MDPESQTSSTGTTETNQVPKAHHTVSLYVSVVSVVFFTTALIGIIVGYLTITNSQNTVNDITGQLRTSIFNNCYRECMKTIDDATMSLLVAANNENAISYVNDEKPDTVLFNKTLTVAIIDTTTNFLPIKRSILGFNNNKTVQLGPPSPGQPRTKFYVPIQNPGSLYWIAPIYTSAIRTYVIPLTLPTWKNYLPGQTGQGPPDASYVVTLSIASLDAFLKTVTITPNGAIMLINGFTGTMLASSISNVSFNANTSLPYPAIGNPSPLISDTVQYLVDKFSTNRTFQTLYKDSSSAMISGKYNNGQDDILVNAYWIYNSTTNLNWLLVLAIPSNDFDGAIRQTLKMSIVAIVSICVGGFLLAIGLSRYITLPIWKLTKAMEEATKFDFSALKEGHLKERSYLTEIGTMQTVFNTMIVKFASAIKTNASLMKGPGVSSTMSQSQHTTGGVPVSAGRLSRAQGP